ncbi:hypothetical protein GCM10029978_030900 [Actinoallomurus acanthiterrae]
MQAEANVLIRCPSNQEVRRWLTDSQRLPRLTGRTRPLRGVITFTETTGEICDATCRGDANLERARAAVVANSLGYGI